MAKRGLLGDWHTVGLQSRVLWTRSISPSEKESHRLGVAETLLYLLMRLYQNEEMCRASHSLYPTHAPCMPCLGLCSLRACQPDPCFLSGLWCSHGSPACTVKPAAVPKSYGGLFCLPRRTGRPFCGSECSLWPWGGKTCPAGSRSCE